jgi:hypothetical protein
MTTTKAAKKTTKAAKKTTKATKKTTKAAKKKTKARTFIGSTPESIAAYVAASAAYVAASATLSQIRSGSFVINALKSVGPAKKTTKGWRSRETPPLYDPKPGALGTPVLVWPYRDRCDLKPRVMMAYYGVRVTDTPEFYLYGAVLGDITQWQPVPEGPEEV